MAHRLFSPLFCLVLLFTAPGVTGETAYSYPLSRPPLAVVRAATLAEMRAIWQTPLLQRALAAAQNADKNFSPDILWRHISFLAPFSPTAFCQALDDAQASDLHLFVLPPARPPWQGALLARTTASGAEKFMTKLGISASSMAVAAKVSCVYANGWLCLTSPATSDEPWLRGSAPMWLRNEKWRQALENFLGHPPQGAACWLDGAWALEAIAYFCDMESPLGLRLQTAGLSKPAAFSLQIQRQGDGSRWRLTAGDSGLPPQNSDGAAPLNAAADIAAYLHLEPIIRRMAGATERSAWPAFLRIIAITDPVAASNIEAQSDALCMLTGCHPRDLFAMLKPAVWLTVQAAERGEVEWAAICEANSSDRLRRWLRRAMAWAAFLGEKTRGWTAEEVPGQAVWSGKISRPFRAVFRLDARHLIIANTERRAEAAAAAVIAWPTPPAETVLAWQMRWPSALRVSLAPSLGGLGFLTQWLEQESGMLTLADRALCLVSSGKSAPLSLIALAVAGVQAFDKEDAEAQAIAWMRLILAAQQAYRHLDLGVFNGGSGGYADDLAMLVDGKGEKDAPLAEMYDRIFSSSTSAGAIAEETLSFSTVIRALARFEREGGYFCGYRFFQPKRRRGRPLDFTREWFIMAWPWQTDSQPALLLDQDGRLYRRRVLVGEEPAAAAVLPDNLNAAGWRER